MMTYQFKNCVQTSWLKNDMLSFAQCIEDAVQANIEPMELYSAIKEVDENVTQEKFNEVLAESDLIKLQACVTCGG
jgi:hypothetical protein